MNLNDWFFHIKQIHTQRMELGLDRIGLVASRMQLTHFNCPVITVGGTNGKGSCTKTLESIYHAAGYKTALYTSPHLLEFNERIRIDNHDIADHELIRAFNAVEKARGDIILSFFEFITLSALFLFKEKNNDVIILEVGLGGRLDAVNIVESDVAVVTSIALDHIDWLGNDRETIAYEKTSIARAQKPLISGEENPPQKIAETVELKKAILYQINRDYFYCLSDNYFCYSDQHDIYDKLPVPHLKHQNVATAIAAIQALKKKLPISQKHIAQGIQSICLSGRFEKNASPFPMVLDVAHNPHAAVWLAQQYAQLPTVNKSIAVIGMLKDKAMTDTVLPLMPFIHTWCVCNLISESPERGSDGSELFTFFKKNGKSVEIFADVATAMQFVLRANCQQECDRALIFGSFHTVAAAKRWLIENE
ncbi:MAG: bifunctional tetrahydrofolate synthase/dihydrofolate synthase [Gammaproteobacteria bacterium CG_4_10_14_0_8_um_filter_38_16]|nr:MAG: bifunctional tetrahydrofolate synthase/dihydrofolate synthase [Gammaproteobacteria bacterium CG_4_10_14_0_8_um_filter_38_16]PJA03472.1 MAG: bifunctional tetrahydrofolate synthase/dihydrofolate synthase [Gammaproteobacteria bacterium CG_4_10_14_0_2_um_filter_38_22]PJB10627.1 MAG: bifunctional tetrahydrofolate synthase/dihydrofolate synthase [Gammaproteobacteria bacterium CG_4_9_14_3_um_filter_38_9]